MIAGVCIGGPLDGEMWDQPKRIGPKGFLVVNRPKAEVVIYDFDADRVVYIARPVEPEVADRQARKNRYRAALEPNYDVVAYDAGVMGPWAR